MQGKVTLDCRDIERGSVRWLEIGLDERLGVHGEASITPRPQKRKQRESNECETADRRPRQRMEVVSAEPPAKERRRDGSGGYQRPSVRPQFRHDSLLLVERTVSLVVGEGVSGRIDRSRQTGLHPAKLREAADSSAVRAERVTGGA